MGGLRVLELGCGDGRLTFRYADAAASVLGVETKCAGIARARADYLRSSPIAFRSRSRARPRWTPM
jgi:cyclopropane fatty-acyl-phospholipid synthase-like methyltransferase